MARFKSIIYNEIKGSVGGLSYQSGKSVQIVRQRIKPVLVKSNKRSVATSNIVFIARSWGLLTDAQRRNWNSFASNKRYAEIIGQGVALSGYQLYLKLNGRALQYGTTLISSPKVPTTMATIAGYTAQPFTSTSMLTNITILNSNSSVFVFQVDATSPLGVGTSKASIGKYKRIVSNKPGVTTGYNMITDYQAVYGALPTSLRGVIYLRSRIVHKASGIASVWVYRKTTFN